MTLLILCGVLAAVAALPLLPAVHEALSRRDAAVLPISDRYAEDLRERIQTPALGADVLDVPGSLDAPDAAAFTLARVHGDARLGAGCRVAETLAVGGALAVGERGELCGTADAGVRADLALPSWPLTTPPPPRCGARGACSSPRALLLAVGRSSGATSTCPRARSSRRRSSCAGGSRSAPARA